MARPLNVYMLTRGPDDLLFYSEAPPAEPIEPPAGKGIKGWADRQLHRFRGALAESNGAAAQTTRKVWRWLQSRTHPDETLLARLRHSKTILVNHPAKMSAKEAELLWNRFLAKGRRRHLPWFVVNLMVSPITVLLAPLPGPNLIGYWFVYRAFHHMMILVGLKRLKADQIETSFGNHEWLDADIKTQLSPDHLAKLTAIGGRREDLVEFLQRHGMKVD